MPLGAIGRRVLAPCGGRHVEWDVEVFVEQLVDRHARRFDGHGRRKLQVGA